MATDTTELAAAIRAMRVAVAVADAAIMYDKVPSTIQAEARIFGAFRNEIEAGRALLAALEGQAGEWEQVRTQNADLREFIRSQDARIAALEVVVTMARTVLDEARWVEIPMGVTIINNAIDTTPQRGDLADLEDALLALGATHGD